MVANENYIRRIIGNIREDLFPALGNFTKHEICGHQCLTFSEIYSVKLYFKQSVKSIILKKYLKEKRANDDQLSVEREYNILNFLYQRFLSLEGINVIKPLAFLLEEDILITEEFVADKLNSLIVNEVRWIPSKRKKKQIENYFFQCGRWLRDFQKFTRKNEVTPFSHDRYVENIEKKLASSIKYGLKKTFHKKIYQFIDDRFKRIGNQKLDLVGYHGDFTPWNVLASDNEIRVLDLDRFSYRNMYEDLTLFLCCLESEKSIVGMTNKNINILKDAFIQGYDIEKMVHDIFNLYILKNTLKALNCIDIYKNANTKSIDLLYEKYRKKRQIKLYLNYIDNLIINKNSKIEKIN
ncbi:MAG: phosphotransferase [Candidatus Scalindua sp.]